MGCGCSKKKSVVQPQKITKTAASNRQTATNANKTKRRIIRRAYR